MDLKVLQRRLQKLEKDFNQLRGQLNQGPLRLQPPSFQTVEFFWCRSNEDAPSDRRYILADLLDKSGLPIVEGDGHNIEVYFTVFAPDDKNLDKCVPYIKQDPELKWPIPIIKRPVNVESEVVYRWHCLWPVNISQVCKCDKGD